MTLKHECQQGLMHLAVPAMHPQGLALPGLSKEGQMPAFFRMLESGMLDEPLFSMWLSPDPTAEPAGKVMFGGHNPMRYQGDLQDITVISSKWGSYRLCSPLSTVGFTKQCSTLSAWQGPATSGRLCILT